MIGIYPSPSQLALQLGKGGTSLLSNLWINTKTHVKNTPTPPPPNEIVLSYFQLSLISYIIPKLGKVWPFLKIIVYLYYKKEKRLYDVYLYEHKIHVQHFQKITSF